MKSVKQTKNQAQVTHRRRLTGEVVSDKMAQTVVVKVLTFKMHPKYKKQYQQSHKYKAHAVDKAYKVGDVVVIEACRPMSADKRWRVVAKVK